MEHPVKFNQIKNYDSRLGGWTTKEGIGDMETVTVRVRFSQIVFDNQGKLYALDTQGYIWMCIGQGEWKRVQSPQEQIK